MGGRGGGNESSVASLVDAESTVLLSAPALDHREDAACIDLLTGTVSGERPNVLSVSFTRSPDQRIALWQQHAPGDHPARAGLISVQDPLRAARAGSSVEFESAETTFSLTGIANPGDLTTLGVRISEYLREWEAADEPIVVCFHTLTTLLQYADLDRVFRFLHVLTARLEDVGAVAHFHIDPTAHDDETVATITQLLDGVIRLDESGAWQIHSRGPG